MPLPIHKQFIRYVVVGGVAFCVDFAALFVLTSAFGVYYLTSATIGFTLGLVVNYLLCITWIFEFRTLESRMQEFALFAAIGVAGLILNNLILYALTDWAGIHYLISKAFAAGVILLFNFTLRRAILFSDKQQTSRALQK